MAENNFLSGLKVDQFIKANNDQMKQTLGDSFSVVAKSVNDIIKMQKVTVKTLQSIDDKVSDISNINKTVSRIYDLQKAQIKLLGGKDKEISKSIDKVMSQHYKKIRDKEVSNREPKVTTRDYFKREDMMQDSEDLLSSIDKGIYSLIASDKKKKQGGGLLGALGILGSLGGLLAGGGLLGYLLTGKQEMLNSVFKGLRYTAKGFLSTLTKSFEGMAKTAKVVPKMFDKVGDFAKLFKNTGTLGVIAKSIMSLGDIITKVSSTMGKTVETISKITSGASRIAKAVTHGGIKGGVKAASRMFNASKVGSITSKGAGTIAGKTAGKLALKRIPVLGTLMSIGFAIGRFKKGDIAGGAMELGSGGLGLLDLVAPGVGTALSLGMDGLILMRDFKKSKAQKGDKGGDALDTSEEKITKGNKFLGVTSKESKHQMRIGNKLRSYLTALAGDRDVDVGGANRSLSGHKKSLDIVKNGYEHSVKINKKADLSGVNPIMLNKFMAMANEYNRLTGGYLLVNDGKRNGTGESTHDHGFAIDVNAIASNGARYGDGYVPDNLLSKYGFHKPLKYWKSAYGGPKDEGWHIEPYPGEDIYGSKPNTLAPNPQTYRVGSLMGGSSKNPWVSTGTVSNVKGDTGGDAIDNNLPNGSIQKNVKPDKPLQVILSKNDIESLSQSIGKYVGNNIPPQQKRAVLPSGGGSGRSNI